MKFAVSNIALSPYDHADELAGPAEMRFSGLEIANDDFMEDGAVFYDVGAHVGVFSLYAATRKNARVFAFEPIAANYSALNENINLNGLSERITALPIAMHNKTMVSHFNVTMLVPGKAGHSF